MQLSFKVLAMTTQTNISPLCYTTYLSGFNAMRIRYTISFATPVLNFDDAMVWLHQISTLLREFVDNLRVKFVKHGSGSKTVDKKNATS
jgi:hypothetical protein